MIWYTKAMAIEWRRFLKTEPCTCGGWLLAVGNLAELLFHGLPQHTEVDSQSLTPAPSWVCLKKCLKMMGENSENRKFPLMIINHHVSIPMMIKHVSWRWTPHVWINPSHRKIQMAELHQVYSGHKCQTLRVVTLHLNSTRHIAPQHMSFIAFSFCFRKNSSPSWDLKWMWSSTPDRINVNQYRKQANSMRKMLFNTITAATKPATSLPLKLLRYFGKVRLAMT